MPKQKRPRKPKAEVEVIRPQGRPPDLDEEKLQVLLKSLRIGAALDVATLLADTTSTTIRTYVQKARENPDSVYGRWAREVFKALSYSEVRDLSVIDSAAQGRPAEFKQIAQLDRDGRPILDAKGHPIMVVQLDGEGKPIMLRSETRPSWQAAAWKLERRAPKRWGRLDRIGSDDLEELLRDRSQQTEEQRIDAGDLELRAKRLLKLKAVLEAVPLDTDLGEVE